MGRHSIQGLCERNRGHEYAEARQRLGSSKRAAQHGPQYYALSLLLFFSVTLSAQFSVYDSLIGTEHELRNYDITFYHLDLSINPEEQSISGSNKICFTHHYWQSTIQIELAPTLAIEKIVRGNKELSFKRDSMRVLIELANEIPTNKKDSLLRIEQCIVVHYGGKPKVAKDPPWDGGFVWTKDAKERPYAGVAIQTDGAHQWWPCKSSWLDKPDSMRMTFRGPVNQKIISNGAFLGEKKTKTQRISEWEVSTPIAPYNVSFYLGNYKSFKLPYKHTFLNFYTLDYNVKKAQKHFAQCVTLVTEYEKLYDSYPFWKDGFKVVESPYLGMEHQTAVAYGNQFVNDVMDYDFILLHEIAHEWWGNSVSASDPAYMWIQEAMTTYTESLFFEKMYGKEKSQVYLMMQKRRIKNQKVIEGIPGKNFIHYPDPDMYYRGTWMFNSMRHHVNNDSLWFSALRELYDHFYMESVTGPEFVAKLTELCRQDLYPIFDYFLHTTKEPVLYYKEDTLGTVELWSAEKLPFKIFSENKELAIDTVGTKYSLTPGQLRQLHHSYYVDLKKVE